MRLTGDGIKNLTLLKAAVYLFLLALCAKGVALYANQHPPEEELLFVSGIVKKVRLGGDGRATRFQIQSGNRIYQCSSYYGKVWPGMERIAPGDQVNVLLERNRLNRDELISGRRYYLWELIHHDNVIVAYEDIRAMVQEKEAAANRFFNGFIAASFLLLAIAFLRKRAKGISS